jgi:hypothetical protein
MKQQRQRCGEVYRHGETSPMLASPTVVTVSLNESKTPQGMGTIVQAIDARMYQLLHSQKTTSKDGQRERWRNPLCLLRDIANQGPI